MCQFLHTAFLSFLSTNCMDKYFNLVYIFIIAINLFYSELLKTKADGPVVQILDLRCCSEKLRELFYQLAVVGFQFASWLLLAVQVSSWVWFYIWLLIMDRHSYFTNCKRNCVKLILYLLIRLTDEFLQERLPSIRKNCNEMDFPKVQTLYFLLFLFQLHGAIFLSCCF